MGIASVQTARAARAKAGAKPKLRLCFFLGVMHKGAYPFFLVFSLVLGRNVKREKKVSLKRK